MTEKKKICCFFGHRELYDSKENVESLLTNVIETLIVDAGVVEFYFGGYGRFDALAFRITNDLKEKYPHIKTTYVQAYCKPRDEYLETLRTFYDDIMYPEIEDKPKKFAITYRNRAMIDDSNYCVFYVKKEYGGAYDAMRYANRKKKIMTNISDLLIKTR